MKRTVGFGFEKGNGIETSQKQDRNMSMLRENDEGSHNSFLGRLKRNAAITTFGVGVAAFAVASALTGCGNNQAASDYTYKTVKIDPSLVAGQQNGTYSAAFEDLLVGNGFQGNSIALKEAASDVNEGDVLAVFGQDKNVTIFYEPQAGRRAYGEAWFYFGPAEASVSEAEAVERQIRRELPKEIQMAPVGAKLLAEVMTENLYVTAEEPPTPAATPSATAETDSEGFVFTNTAVGMNNNVSNSSKLASGVKAVFKDYGLSDSDIRLLTPEQIRSINSGNPLVFIKNKQIHMFIMNEGMVGQLLPVWVMENSPMSAAEAVKIEIYVQKFMPNNPLVEPSGEAYAAMSTGAQNSSGAIASTQASPEFGASQAWKETATQSQKPSQNVWEKIGKAILVDVLFRNWWTSTLTVVTVFVGGFYLVNKGVKVVNKMLNKVFTGDERVGSAIHRAESPATDIGDYGYSHSEQVRAQMDQQIENMRQKRDQGS